VEKKRSDGNHHVHHHHYYYLITHYINLLVKAYINEEACPLLSYSLTTSIFLVKASINEGFSILPCPPSSSCAGGG